MRRVENFAAGELCVAGRQPWNCKTSYESGAIEANKTESIGFEGQNIVPKEQCLSSGPNL